MRTVLALLTVVLVPQAAGLHAQESTLPDDPREAARQILAATGVEGGLVVHLGCGDGRLTAALGTGERFLVHGLDADPGNVEKAREHVRSLGLYGKVSVERWTQRRLPYADNLVNLLVAEDLGPVPPEEVMRVLAPNGVAYVKREGRWTLSKKTWPEEIDEWTHWLHGADGNAVAKDRVVGPPRRVQWFEGPLWARHHEFNTSVTAMVSARGRIFTICDEAPATASGLPDQWSLIARDAFNGVLLWKRPMPEWGWKTWSEREPGGRFNLPIYIARRLVAVGDRVYVTLGFNAPLTALDAATGETLKTYDGTQFTDEITLHDGILVLSVNEAPQGPGLMSASPPVKKQIVALKADTGEILWRRGDYLGISPKFDFLERITHLSLAVAGGRVFFLEEDAVVGLDLKTGRELWRTTRPEKTAERGHVPYKPFNLCTLVAGDDVVLFAQPGEPYTRKTWNRGVKVQLVGLSAATGEGLWTQACSKWGPGVKADVFVIDGLVWTHAADELAAIGIDLKTGRIQRRFSTAEAFNETHHHRCFRNKATERFLLCARRGIDFVDLETEQCETNDWVRGACRYGIVPCNGLIYVPPHPCQCYIDVKLSGFYALAPEEEKSVERGGKSVERGEKSVERGEKSVERGGKSVERGGKSVERGVLSDGGTRLERGPGFDTPATSHQPPATSPAWPTYRHDIRRSGSTRAEVPVKLKRHWQASLGGRVSACTVAGGKVFAAAVDQHRVCALDAEDGEIVWSYTAGGRVDTPPTVHNGLALFGSADGSVSCLRASDGEMVWRFRAAPRPRRIVAFGQLESAWPVHGTVLVKDGVAYVAAGRSTHLDGGIHVYALKPETGEVIRELSPLGNNPHGLEDVLVSDGKLVYMRHLAYGLDGELPDRPSKRKQAGSRSPRAYSTAGLLDNAYFSRVGWSTGAKRGLAHLLVFDPQATYAFRTQRKGGFGGWYQPASGAYQLAAFDRGAGKARWSKTMPVCVRAMVAAGPTLFVAGPPDVVEPTDPWAALENRKGGLLLALDATTGDTLAEYPLESPPAFDGLAAADGRLYLTTTAGNVESFGPP